MAQPDRPPTSDRSATNNNQPVVKEGKAEGKRCCSKWGHRSERRKEPTQDKTNQTERERERRDEK